MRDHLLWRGRSRFTGDPIAAVVTGLDRPSKNRKTGTMATVWVIPHAISPIAAIRSGTDSMVCGLCSLRPILHKLARRARAKMPCYVDTSKAPWAIWNRYRRGGYAAKERGEFPLPVRLTGHGDGATIPLRVIEGIIPRCAHGWTAYTSHWQRRRSLRPYFMASCKSLAEARTAWARGWRTFRVVQANDPLMPNEIACPASAEAGQRTTCDRCGLCDGLGGRSSDTRKSIAIIEH